jgi:hypothetical protein
MTKIIEELEARVAASKQRLDETTKTFQSAQQAHLAAQQEHNVWSLALQTEMRDEQRRTAFATETQLPLPTVKAQIEVPIAPEQVDNSEAPNKTNIVRNLLKQHPTGMSAVDIWKEVGAQFNHRPYLYSVLKRLRDRNEIAKRRNKYCLTALPKAEEVREQSVVH